MSMRLSVGSVGILLVALAATPVRGQNSTVKPLEPLPDGQPNVQGTWAPVNGGSLSLTNPVPQAADFDKTIKPLPSRIIDPPDGKPPYLPWAAALQKQQNHYYAYPMRPEHIDTQHRCIPSGVPRLYTGMPALRIFQTKGQVVLIWDTYHAYRVIPLDGRPHVASNVKFYMGDGRGRWEGKTLVIDTRSVKGARLTYIGDFYSEHAQIMERLTWTDADNFVLEATITDPTVFSRPWTMRVAERRRPNEEMWESACFEGMTDPDKYLLKTAPPPPTN